MRKPTPKPANTANKPKLVAKPAPQPAASKAPVLVATPNDAPADAIIVQTKIKDLIDRVAAATGQKPKDVRDVVVATLAALGTALDQGEALNVPPLGKIKVNRSRDLDNGASLTLKLRRMGAVAAGDTAARKTAKVALVDSGEDS
jgi:hypothetical protein